MKRRTLLSLAIGLLVAGVPMLPATAAAPAAGGDGVLVVTAAGSQKTWVRNFNPFAGNPLHPTRNGIYEPMMIYNKIKDELVPWLATAYKWSDDNKTLTFTLRDGVKWSDGKPFSAKDVAYTFNLLKSTAGLQGVGLQAVSADGYVDSVTASDDKTVVFKFKRVNTPGLLDIVSQNIVPEHVWKDIADPVKATNDDPVGTGPFAKISNFQPQVYQVDKNPSYWQADKVKINGLRVPAFAGNDAVVVSFIKGDIDWSSQFFPNVEQSVIAKNKTDLHYWWPTVGANTLFMMNTTKKPFDDAKVRKAVSMALNRTQMITLILKGQTKPADVTGLSDGFAAVKVQDAAKLGDWTTYNPAKANTLLDEAGYKKGAGGVRQMADGTPLKFNFTMVNGFTDWIAIGPVIVQNLKAIGIDATIKTMDIPVAFDSWMKGTFDMSLFFGVDAASPYGFYRNIMSKDTLKPVGTDTQLFQNHWRFADAKADELLTQYANSADPAKQKEIAGQPQKIFADLAPVIPMWGAPSFYNYNTKRFDGWPSKDNPYTVGIATQESPTELLVFTTLKPK